MPDLTPAQRQRLLDAFNAMDQYAWGKPPKDPQWTEFYYDGYITLDGLFYVAEVISGILAEQTIAAFKARQPSPPVP